MTLGRTIHRPLYRASAGRIGGRLAGWPVLLLTTAGRVSGRPITIVLNYLSDGDRIVVAASNAGQPRHPAWDLNPKADPPVLIQIGAKKRGQVAREASPEERDALWRRIVPSTLQRRVPGPHLPTDPGCGADAPSVTRPC